MSGACIAVGRMQSRDRTNVLRTCNTTRSKSNFFYADIKLDTANMDNTNSTFLQNSFETKDRTTISNCLKFLPLLGKPWRHKKTFIRHALFCVRALHGT